MLEVQKYLKDNSLESLTVDLDIKVAVDDEHGLVILNYDQIESPKTHPIVRECRGLVLKQGTWDLVARSFPRFFNWGEVADEMPLFDFSNFWIDSKEDGSLCIIYWHDGKWHANTRGSFGKDLMQFQDFTWREAFLKALGISSYEELDGILDRQLTYVCEFVSPWNKVVRAYSEPKMYLLAVFEGLAELSEVREYVESANGKLPFLLPTRYTFTSIEEIQAFLQRLSEEDPTHEGVVIRDWQNRRWKIKNPTYLSLHKMRGEGDNLYNPKNILPFVMAGEGDELLTYFPEVKDRFYEIKAAVEAEYENLVQLWSETWKIEGQKDFALAIVGKTRFTGLLFDLRKRLSQNQTEEDLKKTWRGATDLILKVMF